MKQIVSVSRRSDIPAFYADWFMNRIREGFAWVPNPFNPAQISAVSLHPQKVACLVFWTRDPRPLLAHLEELDRRGQRYYFQVTLTGLPDFLEPGVPRSAELVAAIRALSRRLGSERVIWRFDPIVLWEAASEERSIQSFARLAGALRGYVQRCVFSFAHYYRQVKTRLERAPDTTNLRFLDPGELSPKQAGLLKGRVGAALADEAAKNGMELFACAEKVDLRPFGIRSARCIDGELIRQLFGLELVQRKDPGQRPECGCLQSVDIGIYGSCRHGCLYCYAAVDRALAGGKAHDPRSPLLLGEAERRRDGQMSLF
ncbi:hypothetical protein DESUT3_01060 [Desulfuromonas versatilis]|uniref:DUF1848 domain-containing protein n=1 Tax=Desulfuromonas versatilis TaxID=2802975 RepID=A0ABM8HR27_9BACT|nr:DUF1848 domain-containing protein [Desulfuromonas versatilis]BCR03037.1 hypothetical protein DESUT3_01060 [Desulfuromonas versatilis]